MQKKNQQLDTTNKEWIVARRYPRQTGLQNTRHEAQTKRNIMEQRRHKQNESTKTDTSCQSLLKNAQRLIYYYCGGRNNNTVRGTYEVVRGEMKISEARIEFFISIHSEAPHKKKKKSLNSKEHRGISWLLLTKRSLEKKRPHIGLSLRWKWDTNGGNRRRDEGNSCVS